MRIQHDGHTIDRNKSEMYDTFAPRVNGKLVISWFSVRDPETHASIKKPIAGAYSMTKLTEYEP